MLNYLRKNSKILLAVLGVLLMLGWLVIPSLESIFQFRQGPQDQNDPVRVSWKGGRLSASELQRLKIVHSAAVNFIYLVLNETRQRQGTPHAPGYMFVNPDPDPNRAQIGISPFNDDGHLVETLILAQRAKELGVKVNDETVKTFLKKLSDYTLDEANLAELMEKALPDSRVAVTPGMLFEHLKTELLAQEVRLMLQAGVESFTPGDITHLGQKSMRLLFRDHGLVPPGEMWQAYVKLNRRVTIEAYPLNVQDFVSKVTAEPKDAELREMFEEYRNREAHPAFADPGFKQPHKVAFQYVKADLEPFLEAAKKEITDDQIAKAYEEGKAKGEFKVTEPPPMKTEDKPGEKPADPNAPKDGDKPAEKPADPAADKPSEKPAEKPADKPADSKEEPKKDDAKKEDAKKDETKKEETKPEPKKNEGSAIARDIQLVNFQADEKKDETKKEEAKKDEPKKDDKPAETKPAETKPAETKPAEEKPADPAAKPEEKPADPAAKPADPAAEPAKEVKFKTLDEVKDEIRTSLARPIAAERREALIGKIILAVNTYAREYSKWKAYDDRDKQLAAEKLPASKAKVEKPAPLDLPKLVGDPSLKVEVVPLVDQFEIQEEIDQPQSDGTTKKVPKYDIGVNGSKFFLQQQQTARFPQFAFDESTGFYNPETLPFSWDQKQFIRGMSTIYIYWKTDEQRAKELDFKAARDSVVAAWKLQEALKLAKAEGEKLAEQAGKGKDLKALVAKPELVVTPPAFSWYTSGSAQFGRATMSSVEGIKYPGTDFMQAVFDLDVGEAGVALDQPEKIVYVVKMLGEEGVSKEDRQKLLEKGNDPELVDAAWQSQMQLQYDLTEEMIKQYHVKWAPDALGEEYE